MFKGTLFARSIPNVSQTLSHLGQEITNHKWLRDHTILLKVSLGNQNGVRANLQHQKQEPIGSAHLGRLQ